MNMNESLFFSIRRRSNGKRKKRGRRLTNQPARHYFKNKERGAGSNIFFWFCRNAWEMFLLILTTSQLVLQLGTISHTHAHIPTLGYLFTCPQCRRFLWLAADLAPAARFHSCLRFLQRLALFTVHKVLTYRYLHTIRVPSMHFAYNCEYILICLMILLRTDLLRLCIWLLNEILKVTMIVVQVGTEKLKKKLQNVKQNSKGIMPIKNLLFPSHKMLFPTSRCDACSHVLCSIFNVGHWSVPIASGSWFLCCLEEKKQVKFWTLFPSFKKSMCMDSAVASAALEETDDGQCLTPPRMTMSW